ncbi:MAG: hypothetical protein CSA32_02595 [Desulfobulbus propionicus]|nr:MAG: hypothetical protein CSA32_02595 [Desulfobulbus propionicus]
MSSSLILVLLSTLLGFFLSLITLILWQKLHRNRQPDTEQRLHLLRKKAEKALEADDVTMQPSAFQRSLLNISMRNTLQQHRLDRLSRPDQPPPEKYVILNNLAELGLDSEEMASIVGISGVEASQLMKLRSIARS